MKYYEGKEVCQGCGKPGSEQKRYSKTDLCPTCSDTLARGRVEGKLDQMEIVRIFDWFHGLTDLKRDHFRGESILDTFVNKVFGSLSLAQKGSSLPKRLFSIQDVKFKRAQPHGTQFYYLPKAIYEPFEELALKLDEAIKELNDKFKSADEYAKQAVQKEKDRIYNEGVEKGRNLLFSLNNGDITMADFSKKLNYEK